MLCSSRPRNSGLCRAHCHAAVVCVQLSREHQRVTQRCLDLDDQLRVLRQQSSADVARLERQLLNQMSACLTQLDAVVSVCVQSADGRKPDVTRLLGVPRKNHSHRAHTHTHRPFFNG